MKRWLSRSRTIDGRIFLCLRLLALAIMIGVALWQLELSAIGAKLQALQVPFFLAACLSLATAQVASALRWQAFGAQFGLRGGRAWFIAAYARGCFYSLLLPTGLGGDSWRILATSSPTGASAAARVVLGERLIGFGFSAMLALVLLPISPYSTGLVIGSAAAATALCVGWICARAAIRMGLGECLLWTVASQIALLASIWLVAQALDASLPLLALPTVALVVAVAMVLPISIGGHGAREAGFVVALAPLGIAASAGVAVGITFGVVLGFVGICGAPFKRLRLEVLSEGSAA